MSDTIPKWAVSYERFAGRMSGAKGSDIADGHALALEAFGNWAKYDDSGLTAFAYLWRRFGPPAFGSDDYKELCCYYLGTPMPGVVLSVDPSASSVAHAFGYLVNRKVDRAHRKPWVEWEAAFQRWYLKDGGERTNEAYTEARYDQTVTKRAAKEIGSFPLRPPTWEKGGWKKGSPVVQEINRALLSAMKELLRPVRVRDVPIDIFGRCDYSEAEAAPSPLAGMGVPVKVMRKEQQRSRRAKS